MLEVKEQGPRKLEKDPGDILRPSVWLWERLRAWHGL